MTTSTRLRNNRVPCRLLSVLLFAMFVVVALAPLVVWAAPRVGEWPQAGVSVNKVGIKKVVIDDCCFPGSVRSVQLGAFGGGGNLEIGVAAQSGILLLDAATLSRNAALDFSAPDGKQIWFGLSPYLVEDNGGFKIAKRGGGFGDVGLLDQAGRQLWSFKPNPKLSPSRMIVDDAKEDERYYVCDRDMIYRLDRNGKVVWKVSELASHITLVRDPKSQETAFATADSSNRTLTIWTASGTRVQQLKLPFRPDGLEFVWNGEISGFVIKSERDVAFIDRQGNHLWTHSYGDLPVVHGPFVTLVRLVSGQQPLLAVRLGSSSATGRSILTLFSLTGTVVYNEYLGTGSGLGTAPVPNEDRERLLTGDGTSKLVLYEVLP